MIDMFKIVDKILFLSRVRIQYKFHDGRFEFHIGPSQYKKGLNTILVL